jgi:hypothetical protein
MNKSVKSCLIVLGIAAAFLMLSLFCYLSFFARPWMVVVKTRVLKPAELKINGIVVDMAPLSNDSGRESIRLEVDCNSSDLSLEFVSLSVAKEELDGTYLTELERRGARPTVIGEKVSHEHISSFVIAKKEMHNAYITISLRRNRVLKVFGPDIFRYWITTADLEGYDAGIIRRE